MKFSDQATHHKTDMTNTYEAPASMNESSMLYESVYLQTCFEEDSVKDNLTTVVTSHSYPITTSEQWTILDDQSCRISHENVYAIQFDVEGPSVGGAACSHVIS